MKSVRWTVLALAVIGAYALTTALLLPGLTDFDDVAHRVDFTVGIALPLHVVWQALGGWRLMVAAWALAAALGIAGPRLAASIALERPRALALIGVQCVLLAALLAVTVTFSGDVYAYVIYGRLYGLHGINPYVLGSAIPDLGDAVLRQCLAFYGNPPPGDNYGPLWTFAAGGLARLESGLPLAAQVWTHRALAALAAVAATGGLLHLARKLPAGERIRRAGTFAFHPLVLYEAAVGGHNDLLMVAAGIWAFAVVDELPLVAALLLGASIAVKYVSVIVLPFLALRAARRGLASGALALIVALAVPALFFQPFWAGAQTVYSLIGHGGVFAMSPQWLVNIPFFASGTANSPAFGSALTLPLFGQPSWPRLVQLAAFAAFLAVAAWSVARFARKPATADIWRTIGAFVLSLPIIHPWYVVWIAPAAAHHGRWASYAWWFGMFAFARYALDEFAPAQAGTSYTVMLVALTVLMLAAPVILCLRDRPEPHPGGMGKSEPRADTH